MSLETAHKYLWNASAVMAIVGLTGFAFIMLIHKFDVVYGKLQGGWAITALVFMFGTVAGAIGLMVAGEILSVLERRKPDVTV